MSTPKTLDEWIEAQNFVSPLGMKQYADAECLWHAAQAAVANPWREWSKEKPSLNNDLKAVGVLVYFHTKGTSMPCMYWITDLLGAWARWGPPPSFWQYITPSPFSVPVKSEADIAFEEYCKKHRLVCVFNSQAHFDFTSGFNLGLEKGRDAEKQEGSK